MLCGHMLPLRHLPVEDRLHSISPMSPGQERWQYKALSGPSRGLSENFKSHKHTDIGSKQRVSKSHMTNDMRPSICNIHLASASSLFRRSVRFDATLVSLMERLHSRA